MKIKFRQAAPADAEIAHRLIYSAGSEGFDYVFNHKDKTAHGFIKFAFTDGAGLFGHRVHVAAEIDGRVVGMASFYSGREFFSLNASMGRLILQYYGIINCLAIYRKSFHTLALLPAPARDMEYVGDLGVVEDMRGKGIGRAILAYGLEKAKRDNCSRYAIDVAVNNGRAQKLYESFGFRVTGLNKFRGPAGPVHVPDARRMEMNI